MALHTIRISVNIDDHGNANFSYCPSVQRVYAQDAVKWTSTDGPFAVQFQETTPLRKMDSRGQQSGDGEGRRVWESEPLKVRGSARGHFHYSVAIAKGDAVYVDGSCPEIIAN